jgi:hypothetical protein
MLANNTYITAAEALHRAGDWDTALALLSDRGEEAGRRAQILVDRFFFRQDDPTAATTAVDGLDPDTVPARYLRAQLAYTRLLFDRDPLPDDAQTAAAGFAAAAGDPRLRGWGSFWLGVLADNVHEDAATARARYDEALRLSQQDGDLLLESYVVRHLGGHALADDRAAGLRLLRRSLQLRAALGARPQVAAAQAALADELPDGPERDLLREAALAAARDLGLTWLVDALDPV